MIKRARVIEARNKWAARTQTKPVLHVNKPGWHFTALYSNTARAHELDRTRDWVVIYAEDESFHERPYTVVTAGRGTLVGRRVVRGREVECRQWYAETAVA